MLEIQKLYHYHCILGTYHGYIYIYIYIYIYLQPCFGIALIIEGTRNKCGRSFAIILLNKRIKSEGDHQVQNISEVCVSNLSYLQYKVV